MSAARGVLLLVVALVPSGSSASIPPVTLALAPISDEALHGCRAAELEKTLLGRLARGKRFHLLRDVEKPQASLEILECSRSERQEGKFTAKGGAFPGTRGGGERDLRVQTETTRVVALRARIVSGDRFIDVASGPKDRTLSEAADTVRRAIDEALKSRGDWLVGARP
jgi:hypothetical protein